MYLRSVKYLKVIVLFFALIAAGKSFANSNDLDVRDAWARMNEVPSDFDYDSPAFFSKINESNVLINGTLGTETFNRFSRYLRNNPQTKKIFIGDVPGSDDDESMREMLLFIADQGIDTHLLKKAESGGVDLWLAGRIRTRDTDSVIGVHSWGSLLSADDLNEVLTRGYISQEQYNQFLKERRLEEGLFYMQATDYPEDYYEHSEFIEMLHESGVLDAEIFYLYTIKAAPVEDMHLMTNEEIAQYRLVREQLFNHIPGNLMPEGQKQALSSIQGEGIGGIVNSLYTGNTADVKKTLRLISSPTAVIANTGFADITGLQSLLDSRMALSRSNQADENTASGLWIDMASGNQEKDSKNTTPGYKTDMTSRTLGFENQLTADTVLGIFYSDRKNDSKYHENGGKSVTKGDYIGIYGKTFFDSYFTEASLLVGKSETDITRNIDVGRTSQKSSSTVDSRGHGVSVLGGKDFQFDQLKITPVIGVSYSKVSVDDYKESGSIISVAADKTDFESYVAKSGVRVSHPLNTSWFTGNIALNACWLRQLGDTDRDHRVRFINGGNRFSLAGVEGDKNIYQTQLGYNVSFTENLSLSLDMTHIRDDDHGDNEYSMELNYRF